jgi:hypothetical protein
MNLEETQFMLQFLSDGKAARNEAFTKEIADGILESVKPFAKSTWNEGDLVLNFVLSMNFGNIEIQEVSEMSEFSKEEPRQMSFKKGGYCSCFGKRSLIYFGPKGKQGPEPYNRQGCLYVPYSWEDLDLVEEMESCDVYVFQGRMANISFGITAWWFSDFWKTLRFGIVIDPKDKTEVISKVVKLLKFI